MKRGPIGDPVALAPDPAWRWQKPALQGLALVGPPLLVAGLLWACFGSYDHFLLALDRASALGPCRGPAGAKPLCDFANHYYPQGRALAESPVALPGFLYSAGFALWMRLWALFAYPVARALWAAVVLAAALVLIGLPLAREFRRSLPGCALHGLLFAGTLPLWHDLAFGQVSSLSTALVVVSFLTYGRGRRALAAVLVGLAASIKFYPALFAVYFALRRDRRALSVFAGTLLAASAILPLLFLGESGLLTFYRSLRTGLEQMAHGTAANAFSNFVANAVTHLLLGRVDPASFLYRTALAVGLGIAGFHTWLAWRQVRRQATASVYPALMLGLASLPFVVRSCWVHYFVFLPLLQGFVAEGGMASLGSRPLRWLVLSSVAVSAALVSVPLLLLVGGERYYASALPFWATAILLPGLYHRILAGPDAA